MKRGGRADTWHQHPSLRSHSRCGMLALLVTLVFLYACLLLSLSSFLSPPHGSLLRRAVALQGARVCREAKVAVRETRGEQKEGFKQWG